MSDNIHLEGGYAARRVKSCLPSENLKPSWKPRYVACCPDGMYPTYNDSDKNYYCSGSETSDSFVPKVCANETWNLYYNTAFLCCDQGMIAYLSKQENGDISDATFGCDTPNYVHAIKRNHSEGIIDIIDRYNPPNDNSSSGPNKGAIAGGVVGGVCALIIAGIIAFFLLRRRRRIKAWENIPPGPVSDSDAPKPSDSRNQPSEIEGNNKSMYELHDPSPKRNELQGDEQIRQELAGDSGKDARRGPACELP